MREFEGGATRDTDQGKVDPDGYLSPEVLQAFFDYMLRHQTCCDGTKRSSDNWKSGIPRDVYLKSLWRHFFSAWTIYRDSKSHPTEEMVEALCGVLFNTQGLLHEVLKEQSNGDVRGVPKVEPTQGQGAGECGREVGHFHWATGSAPPRGGDGSGER